MKFTLKNLFICLLPLLPIFIKAQQKLDTVFYNRNWIETSIKDSAHFYRIATKLENSYKVEDYYISNKIQMIGFVVSLKQNSKTGHFQYFFENGKLSSEGNFENNEMEGAWKNYYENGKIWYQTSYYKSLKNGTLESFYRNGELKRKAEYEMDVLVKELCFDSKVNNADFIPLTTDPIYKGGEEAMSKFISDHAIYPRKAKRGNIEGKVVVRFLVTKKGKIDSIEVLSKPQTIFDNEAISAVKKMPLWIPGKADCEPSGVYFVLPIIFKLEE